MCKNAFPNHAGICLRCKKRLFKGNFSLTVETQIRTQKLVASERVSTVQTQPVTILLFNFRGKFHRHGITSTVGGIA